MYLISLLSTGHIRMEQEGEEFLLCGGGGGGGMAKDDLIAYTIDTKVLQKLE